MDEMNVDYMEEDDMMYEIEMDEDDDDMEMGGMGETMYEIEMDEDDDNMEMGGMMNFTDDMGGDYMGETMYEIEMEEDDDMGETMYEIEMEVDDADLTEDDNDMMDFMGSDSEETMYEIEMGDDGLSEEDDDMGNPMDEYMEGADMTDFTDDMVGESYNPKKAKRTVKPKGMGIGSGPKFKYGKPNTGGFKEDKKEGSKTMGTGKPKFEYKEGKNTEGKMKMVKKTETKEASRTYGMGSKEGRGLRKGITPNRNLKFEAYEVEIDMLREKNEEYRKALNTFREKLNEVATFNSNLAYATRLFTEHSTTKKEKINILRRFDNVETLKESKNLYKSVKDELMKGESKPMNESVENKLNKNVSTGSSTTLIESKTYENPQFLRIKDLMGKML